jgi:hypothetical protein
LVFPVPFPGKGGIHAAQHALAAVIICLAERRLGALSNRRNAGWRMACIVRSGVMIRCV